MASRSLRKYIALLQEKLVGFYAYREAMTSLAGRALRHADFQRRTTEATIQGFFQIVGRDGRNTHNETIRESVRRQSDEDGISNSSCRTWIVIS